ncbi:hypothetical protein CSV63_03060 [Sporosarcina sp. P34]|uniref:glycine-rich protein n=1 Tax=Sporosarcina sp. P34 TaxID=2048247 RepID=UPI000C16F0E2|nr:glycine-rich protein [Sporosarcina sp. P34]PID16885.1 hypothetical protein CSV63_03060 [Sporosarcina sp. P34]
MAPIIGTDSQGRKTYTFGYTGAPEIYAGPSGVLLVEAWGAGSGELYNSGWPLNQVIDRRSYGGYAKGIYTAKRNQTLYVHVGGKGEKSGAAGWNGGGAAGTGVGKNVWSGGDGTDVRTGGGLDSRIIVAGGAGGYVPDGKGGNGGGLEGGKGVTNSSLDDNFNDTGGKQGLGGKVSRLRDTPPYDGQFGKGANGGYAGVQPNGENGKPGGGGGGGWYGGAAGQGGSEKGRGGSGGGGSSYIALLTDGETNSGVNEGHGKVVITVISSNTEPTITLATSDNRTLYESDTYTISGTSTETDVGDVVMVKYKVNSGTARTIASPVSTGAEFPFNRSLTFKESKLFDGATAVTGALAEGTQHVLTVWAEDDKGGKSPEVTRTFYVVPNRPPKLTVDPITPKTDMIDSDSFEIKGTVNNPDANGVKVHYKISNSAFNEVYTSDGAGGEFTFRVSLSQLMIGANSLTVRATDHFGAVDTKTITITKAGNVIPLKQAVTRYKMLPPNGTAKGVLLWIEREVGDLVVDARISMTAAGEPEHFVPMTKNKTAFVSEGIEEDEYLLDAGADKSNIILEITEKRTSTASEKGITKITGVFA